MYLIRLKIKEYVLKIPKYFKLCNIILIKQIHNYYVYGLKTPINSMRKILYKYCKQMYLNN